MPNCSHAHPSPAFCMAGNFAIPVELRQTAPCVNESLTPNCVYCLRAVSWNWSYQAKGCVQGLRSFTPAAGLPSRKNVTVMWPPERLCLQSAWQGFRKPTSLVEFALLPSSVNLNTSPPPPPPTVLSTFMSTFACSWPLPVWSLELELCPEPQV